VLLGRRRGDAIAGEGLQGEDQKINRAAVSVVHLRTVYLLTALRAALRAAPHATPRAARGGGGGGGLTSGGTWPGLLVVVVVLLLLLLLLRGLRARPAVAPKGRVQEGTEAIGQGQRVVEGQGAGGRQFEVEAEAPRGGGESARPQEARHLGETPRG